MDYELKERITQIRNALTLIWNVHHSEFTFYEGVCIDKAYWALVDIFDKRRAKEFEDAGKEVDEMLKKEMKNETN